MNQIILLAANSEQTSISVALLNTVLSIAIVFIVLIFISFIISLFKYINKAEQNAAKKKAAAQPDPVPAAAPSPAVEIEQEEELTDDSELVAVITAAIYAFEAESQGDAQGIEIPADGLIVRSIRKVNKTKWQSA